MAPAPDSCAARAIKGKLVLLLTRKTGRMAPADHDAANSISHVDLYPPLLTAPSGGAYPECCRRISEGPLIGLANGSDEGNAERLRAPRKSKTTAPTLARRCMN